MKKTVFAKITAGYIAVIVLLTSTLFLFSLQTFKNHYTAFLVDDLQRQAKLFIPSLTPLYAQKKYAEIDTLVKQTGTIIKTRITVIRPDGRVVADSEKDPRSMENHATRPEVLKALSGQTGWNIRYSATVDEDMLYVAVPIRDGGAVTGILRMSLFMHDISRLISRFRYGMLWIALCIGILAVAASFLISRRITRPIRMLKDASRTVASGNFDTRVFLDTDDELQEYAESFNVMTETIQRQFNEIVLRQQEIQNIIAAMHEYLLVLDAEGRIVLSNDSFNTFVGAQDVCGRFYWEFIREPEFGEMIKKVRTERKGYIQELRLGSKIVLCSMAWIGQKEEVVAVCLDVTEIRRVESIKKDFVVNVSHELRTPLTAIKGFIDTILEEETDATHRRYLEIVKRHTERLISIVRDLLTLARLEEEQYLDLERVDLVSLVEQVKKIYEQRLEEKGLSCDVIAHEGVGPIQADAFKLEQVFINLIDNAVKYTEKGGITIRIEPADNGVRIAVQDTGIGIRREHLERIFERFYVVDKARSRQTGGTGLGLSIVKHIVMLHRGTIEVSSEPGKGTTFNIQLPADPSAA